MIQPAVSIDSVSKRYRLHHERNWSLKATVLRRRRLSGVEEFWALRDVTLEVAAGTAFGLVGENGCGKSTLLKCITRILRPDSGSVTVRGRASALLELGAGFHPELSGRENVFLNGSVLGMSRKDLSRKLDEIIDFAGLAQFIDQPVKNYSSGMYVRLGFSVAINVDPDVLLVDEVLAVGDEAFQRKCQEKFLDLKADGRTIILVTHDLAAVQRLCDQVAWLDRGQVKLVDSARKVADEYVGHLEGGQQDSVEGGSRWGSGEGRIEHVELLDDKGMPVTRMRTGDPLLVRFHYDLSEPISRPVFGLSFHTPDGVHIAAPNTRDAECVPDRLEGTGHVDFHMERLLLAPGTYEMSVALHDYSCLHPYDFRHQLFRFNVEPGHPRESYGLVALPGVWEVPGHGTRP
ncbi:MAG: ABC transporter ATP-binding protein [Actinomycetota bacterium]|nr:ABC transporter ATP-binding protein [Actinomycetota bacterium]